MDGIHAARCRAGTLLLDDRMIRADIHTAATLDAFFLINDRAAVRPVERDRVLGAYLYTGVGEAALAALCYEHAVFVTAIAGKLDDIDQRRGVVGFLPGSSINVIRYRGVLSRIAAGQAHGQTKALANDCALKENVVAVVADFARDNLIRERFNAPVGRPLGMVRHTGHFAENLAADLLDTGLYASHNNNIPLA